MLRVVAVCLIAALVAAKTVPSFDDGEEYDLVLLSEQEALGALPSHLRLNPKTYESAEEAMRAAENELRNIGEIIDTPNHVTEKAEKKAMSMAIATAQDPYHSDMDGIKVDLGNSGDYAVDEVLPVKKFSAIKKAVPLVSSPKVHIDVQNEQKRTQASSEDVPAVTHIKKVSQVVSLVPKKERIPDGSTHLIEDEHSVFERGTRSQAFGYGMPIFGQMPAPIFPLHNILAGAQPLRAPDLECNGAECQTQTKAEPAAAVNAVPQFPNLFPGMMQMGQAPMFPQFPQGMPSFTNDAQAAPAQIPDFLKQMLTATPQNFPAFPQFQPQAAQQNMWTPPNMQQMMMQGMPQMPPMMPQMMQMMPQMLNQMAFQAPKL